MLQELEMVTVVCGTTCMLHPSLRFVAELEVLNSPPIIKVISEGKHKSTHAKLVAYYMPEFDYFIEGTAITHVLANCSVIQTISTVQVRWIYITVWLTN